MTNESPYYTEIAYDNSGVKLVSNGGGNYSVLGLDGTVFLDFPAPFDTDAVEQFRDYVSNPNPVDTL